MTYTWTDEDRLRADESAHESRLRRINEIVARRDAERTRAEATRPDGIYRLTPPERQEIVAAADAAYKAAIAEEQAEVDQSIDKLEREVADLTVRVSNPDDVLGPADRERTAFLQPRITDDVRDDSPEAIEARLGAAVGSVDRVLGAVIWRAIKSVTRELSSGDPRKVALGRVADVYSRDLLDPAEVKRLKATERRLEKQQEQRRQVWTALHPHIVNDLRAEMAAGGQYKPL